MPNTFDDVIKSLEQVFVRAENNTVEINPEYVYMTIPAEYICTYHKILVLLAQYGVDMLNDCQAGCTNNNKSIINCFNMFNAAVAARKLGLTKQAETIMKYINGQLNLIYKADNLDTSVVWPVDENGYIKAIVTCGENPKFEVDVESGVLFQKSIGNIDEVYALDETDTNSK